MTYDPVRGAPMEEVTRAHIAKLASGGIPQFLDQPGLDPEALTADDVRGRRPLVQARLARLGGYNGSAGDYWKAWLAITRDAGVEPAEAARDLLPSQASWLAMWCFAHGDVDLGCTIFEELTERPAIGVGGDLHHHLIHLCLRWHMIRQRAGDALRVGRHYIGRLGRKPETVALTAVASYLAGAGELAAAQREIARLRPTTTGKLVDAVAIAHELLGDHEAALGAIALLHAGSTFFPPDERVLRALFGERLTRALAKPPPAPPRPPPRVRWRGLVLERSSRASAHRFAPADRAGLPCPGCETPLQTTFQIDVTKVPRLAQVLPGWSSFDAVACFDCSFWMLQHDFVHDASGHVTEVTVVGADDDLRRRFEATPPPPTQFVKTRTAPATLEEMPLDGECQLGGNPAWIQSAEEMRCARCDAAMVFVLRFASPNTFIGSPEIAGGSGALYHFVCPTCRTSARIAQWT